MSTMTTPDRVQSRCDEHGLNRATCLCGQQLDVIHHQARQHCSRCGRSVARAA